MTQFLGVIKIMDIKNVQRKDNKWLEKGNLLERVIWWVW